ncbi:hypothetical protein [Streptomyces sp. NPDC093111]|uniref:hypothetical protein n=1 Tax=Streptomyces sp. NPDC093111 TaxID=3154978 RepID=UPI00344227BA
MITRHNGGFVVECALDREATRRGLGRYRRQAERGTWAGAALVVLALVLLLLPIGASWATDAAAGLGVAGLIALGVALSALRGAVRMRRVLAAGSWSAHPAVAVVRGGMVPPSLVLGDPAGGRAWAFVLAATKQRYERVLPGPDGVLWWCGDPDRGGVLAPPGGEELVWARPVRGHHTRNRTVGLAAAAGLFDRPAAVGPEAVRGWGTVTPEAVASETEPSESRSPEAQAPETQPSETRSPRGRHLPTYAALSAAAQRQALPAGGRGPRREADVRVVSWWRVRSLRRLSGLSRLLVSPVVVVTGLLMTGRPEDYPAVVAYAIVALGVGVVLYSGRGFFASGRGTASALARAARAPEPVPKRYVLLFDPLGGAPVLVLFPYGGGPEDLPEAVLRLYAPGTPKEPRKGLPAAPSGPVELRGGPDGATGPGHGAPVVVPWIEGRPLWPCGPFEELAPGDPAAREYLARLAPPQGVPGVPAP